MPRIVEAQTCLRQRARGHTRRHTAGALATTSQRTSCSSHAHLSRLVRAQVAAERCLIRCSDGAIYSAAIPELVRADLGLVTVQRQSARGTKLQAESRAARVLRH